MLSFSNLFIASAHAQNEATSVAPPPAAPPAQPSTLEAFLPLLLIIFVFYFLIIRPQQKKLKAHRQMIDALRRGDKVMTAGGLLATVKKVEHDADIVHLEIADNVVVKAMRSTLPQVLSRTEPAETAPAATQDNAKK